MIPGQWEGRPRTAVAVAQLVKDNVLGKNEEPRLLVGDNVQVKFDLLLKN